MAIIVSQTQLGTILLSFLAFRVHKISVLETDAFGLDINRKHAPGLILLSLLLLLHLQRLLLLLLFLHLSSQLRGLHLPHVQDEPAQCRLELIRTVEVHSRLESDAAGHHYPLSYAHL